MASRQSDFTRMNPPTFYGSKIDEEPQQFVDEVSKIILAMGLSIREKAEFVTYQLKDVAQAWYVLSRDNRLLRGGPMTWEIFKASFIHWFFPREIREEKVVEFINL